MLNTRSSVSALSAPEALQLYSILKDIVFNPHELLTESLSPEQLKLFHSLYQSLTGTQLSDQTRRKLLYGQVDFCLALAKSPVMQDFLMEDRDGAEIWIQITGNVQFSKADTIWNCCLSLEMLKGLNHEFYLWHEKLLAIYNRESEKIAVDEKGEKSDVKAGLIQVLCERYEDAHHRLHSSLRPLLLSTTKHSSMQTAERSNTYFNLYLILKEPMTAHNFLKAHNDDRLISLWNETFPESMVIAEQDPKRLELLRELRALYCSILIFLQQGDITRSEQFLKNNAFVESNTIKDQASLIQSHFAMKQYQKVLACAAKMGFTEETLRKKHQQHSQYSESRLLSMRTKSSVRRTAPASGDSPWVTVSNWVLWATGQASTAAPLPQPATGVSAINRVTK